MNDGGTAKDPTGLGWALEAPHSAETNRGSRGRGRLRVRGDVNVRTGDFWNEAAAAGLSRGEVILEMGTAVSEEVAEVGLFRSGLVAQCACLFAFLPVRMSACACVYEPVCLSASGEVCRRAG